MQISRRFMDRQDKVGKGCRKAVMNQVNLSILHNHENDAVSVKEREDMKVFFSTVYNNLRAEE